DRDRRERLVRDELGERVGEIRDTRAVVGEPEELDRRARPERERRRRLFAEVAEEAVGEARDLPRAAVADVQRADGDAVEPEAGQEVRPRREAARLDDVLLGVAGEGDAPPRVEA